MSQITYCFGAMKNNYFKREVIKAIDFSKYNALISYYNNTDIYKGCYYHYPDGSYYGDFYLDFDIDSLDQQFNLLKEQVLTVYFQLKKDYNLTDSHISVYYSGAKGFHLIIPAYNMGFSCSKTLNDDYKRIALYYKKISPYIDTKIYDTMRVFRIPNSINSKTGFYKIPLTIDEIITSDFETIANLAKSPREMMRPLSYIIDFETNKRVSRIILDAITKEENVLYRKQKTVFKKAALSPDIIFPCIHRMLEDVHEKGNRNEVLIVIASHFFQKGISFDEALSYFLNWNKDHFYPSLPDKEIYSTLKSALSHCENNQRYGCRSILALDFCDFSCSFKKESRC